MRKVTLAMLLLSAQAASAALFPLTNTRYDTGGGVSLLRTDGTHPFVFWNDRVTHVIEGQNRIGNPLFVTEDAVWTGTRFLAAAESTGTEVPRITGRFVSGGGHPDGPPFVILENASEARMAAGHGRVLMVYHSDGKTWATLLGSDGRAPLTASAITQHHPPAAVAATAEGFAVLTAGSQAVDLTRLDAQGRVVGQQSIARPSYVYSVTLAAAGSKMLLMWTTEDRRVEAAVADERGNIGAPLLIESTATAVTGAAAVWNGVGWTVAYDVSTLGIHVMSVDAFATRVVSREELPAGDVEPSLAVIGGKPVITWSRGFSPLRGPVWMSELPLATNSPRVVSYGPTTQRLVDTVSSADAVLAVWIESANNTHTLRAGRLGHDGQWIEHAVASSAGAESIHAASDGRTFVVFRETEAIFLDEDSRPTGLRVTLPVRVDAVAWNGRHYAVVDMNGNARLLSTTGELSPPIRVNVGFGVSHLASDGNGFLIAGGAVQCPFILCMLVDTRVARLDANLQRIGGEVVIGADSGPAGVAWNGSDYVVISHNGDGTRFTRIAPQSDQVRTGQIAALWLDRLAAASDGNVAALSFVSLTRAGLHLIGPDGELRDTTEFHDRSESARGARIGTFSDGRLVYFSAPLFYGSPHYATRRVAAAIVGGDPAPPAAPVATVRDDSTRFLVQWTTPAGTVNGYRVEYRIDDGAWIEIERWLGPGEQSISIRRPAFGSKFAFRVRAFNDAGAGLYSNEGAPATRKRRAAR